MAGGAGFNREFNVGAMATARSGHGLSRQLIKELEYEHDASWLSPWTPMQFGFAARTV